MGGTLSNLNQNLVRWVPADKIVRPAGYYKSIILEFASVISAGYLSYTYTLYLKDQASFVSLAITSGIFVILSVFGMFLGKNLSRRFLVILLESIALVLYFLPFPITTWGLAALAGLIFIFWGELLARNEMANHLEIKFIKAVRPQISKVTTGLLIVGILLYLPQWTPQKSFFSLDSFRGLFDFVVSVSGRLYPDIDLNGTVGKLAESVARSQLQTKPAFREYAPLIQEKMVKENVGLVIQEIEDALKINVSVDEQASKLFYDVLLKWYSDFTAKLGGQSMFLWAITVFMLLRSAGFLFIFLIATLTFFIYQILLAANFLAVLGENRMHEVIEYT